MLVAVSGSQGSGKTTILDKIQEAGYSTIKRKTSRSILKDWGVELQQVNADPDLTMRFQEEIIKRKYADEVDAVMSSRLVFTERTYADLFTYSLVSLGKDNQYSDWLNKYYNDCMSYNQQYSLVYYLRAGLFKIDHDGTRGSNHHYGRMVDLTMQDFTQQMTHPSRLSIIETPDLEQRVSIILTQSSEILRK